MTTSDSTEAVGRAPVEPTVDADLPATTPKKKPAARKPAGTQTRAPRMQSAASVSKSPSEIVEHIAPPTPDASEIPPVPPLPVIPPVPPLPEGVTSQGTVADTTDSGTRESQANTASLSLGQAESAAGIDSAGQADSPARADSIAAAEGVAAAVQPEGDVLVDESERPPLPEISAEDAALRRETLPDAAEQATGLENHEPMKFVWSKRWPFLSLVPVADVPSATTTTADEADVDALGTDLGDSGESAVPTVQDWLAVDGSDVADRTSETAQPAEDQVVAENDGIVEHEGTIESVGIESDVIAANGTTEETVEFEATTTEWSWLDDPAPEDPIVEDVTIALTSEDDFATEVFVSGAAATAVLPTPERSTVPDAGDEPVASQDDAALVVDVEREEPHVALVSEPGEAPVVLSIQNLSRSFGDTLAVNGIDLEVRAGSFYGIVGPNGAGKTTTLSMVTGLLRPDSGSITVNGIDVWKDPEKAKRTIGVLPDRLRLFDRLTGAQLLYYAGVLRGLDGATVRSRVKDLARAFGLEDALNRLVTDYSAGMTKKVALASAMIHSPRLLVLDEPFESVDPVSAANVIEILQGYVANGGTVVLSSHGMDLIQRVCDHVAIVVNGQVLDAGSVDDVRGDGTLEDRFVELAGGRKAAEGMEWLHSFSD